MYFKTIVFTKLLIVYIEGRNGCNSGDISYTLDMDKPYTIKYTNVIIFGAGDIFNNTKLTIKSKKEERKLYLVSRKKELSFLLKTYSVLKLS